MSIDAACTGCCCLPMTPCCACQGAEFRKRFTIVQRRLVTANGSIPLLDWTDSLILNVLARKTSASCAAGFGTTTLLDLGSSFSFVQRYRAWRFGTGNFNNAEIGYQPSCRPCLTPQIRSDITKSSSGGTIALNMGCENLLCTCPYVLSSNYYWNLGVTMNASTTVAGSHNGVSHNFSATYTRAANVYTSASSCLSQGSFSNIGYQAQSLEAFQVNNNLPPLLALTPPFEIDPPCAEWSGGQVSAPLVRCDLPNQPLTSGFTLSGNSIDECARYICNSSTTPPISVIYTCDCLPYSGNNSDGLYQYQITVSQEISVADL